MPGGRTAKQINEEYKKEMDKRKTKQTQEKKERDERKVLKPSDVLFGRYTDEGKIVGDVRNEQYQPTILTQEKLLQGTKKVRESSEIQQLVEEASKKWNVDPNLINAIITQESRGNKKAVSYKKKKGEYVLDEKGNRIPLAKGLMQFIDITAKEYGITDPMDARQNIMAGAHLLSDLMIETSGNIPMTLAKYNWGSGKMKTAGVTGVENLFEKAPYETKQYIDLVTQYRDFLGSLSTYSNAPINTPINEVQKEKEIQKEKEKKIEDQSLNILTNIERYTAATAKHTAEKQDIINRPSINVGAIYG
jgi:hypothetical protein